MTDYDPTDIRQQERAAADKAQRERIAQEGEEADVRWLMSSKRGRRILWRLLEHSGVFRLSFNTNAMQMAFAEGNRNLGNRYLTLIHAVSPENYPVMAKENTDDDRNSDDR